MPKLWLTAKRSSRTTKLDLVVLVAGELAVALGSVVLFGWYTHSPWLVQLRPTFAPMQYNPPPFDTRWLVCNLPPDKRFQQFQWRTHACS